jgi:tetratricopeptide (TPR) repeat protein
VGGGISYSFSKDEEGWSIPGISDVGPTRPKLNDDELVSARIKELDRRIATQPDKLEDHRKKIAYLVHLGRNKEAVNACEAAAESLPHWWVPQYGMALLAREDEAEAAETRFRTWVDAHSTFLNYYYLARYYRERNRHKDALAALKQAVEYPLLDGQPNEHNWVATGFAFEAAMYSCRKQDHQLTLGITKVWSAYYPPSSRFPSMEHCAFRAAANLGLGNLAEARSDVALAVDWSTARFGKPRSIFYAGNLDQLQGAIEKSDKTFVYNPGELAESTFSNWDWLWPRFYPDEL